MKTLLVFLSILVSALFASWTKPASLTHDFSYTDSHGNKITIEDTYKFQTVLDTNFIISNLTGKHLDPFEFDSTDQKYNYRIIEVAKIKNKKKDAKKFDLYDLRVLTEESKFIPGYRHFLLIVSKTEGTPKIKRVIYLSAEI